MSIRKLDRTAVRKIKLGEEGSDVAYWRSRPPGERLAQVTSLVLEHHGKPLPAMQKTVTAIHTLGDEKPSNADLAGSTPAERIDVLTSVEAVTFEGAWPERLEIELEGMPVPVIGREHFIRNKRATGRAKDQVDAEALEDAENRPS